MISFICFCFLLGLMYLFMMLVITCVIAVHVVHPYSSIDALHGRQLHKNAASNIEQVLAATPTIRPPASHHENYPS